MALVYTAFRNYLVGVALLAFFMLSIQLSHFSSQKVAPHEANQVVLDTLSEKTEQKQEDKVKEQKDKVIDMPEIPGAIKTETNMNEEIRPPREADI